MALKFLSAKHSQDEVLLQRFIGEVRLARQVSHPNVCRVYDIGESDGRHYLSMEYVDGEDLASLLKRIGRLPSDKALEVARQLCAGLAAAHDKGVLHRDLKPANVMLDGRGQARITDFGLAVAAGQQTIERGLAGTPAYMAPEQLTGGDVTVRTDLFALGLILYELFTGKRAFEGRTVAERLRAMESSKAESLTGIAGTDPAVERAILRCLEKDPANRPGSAQAVAAAMPGGDPLAAALAAGETPSPEMVAAAGETGGLSPAVAWACLAGVVLGLFCAAWLSKWSSLHRFVPLEKPPDFLAVRAREVLTGLGYTEPPVNSAFFFSWNEVHPGAPVPRALLEHIAKQDQSPDRWKALRSGQPAVLTFVYRQSPRQIMATGHFPIVSAVDPPLTIPGMVNVVLDTQGKLVSLRAVAPAFEALKERVPEPEWSKLFAAAGLDMARFKPATPQWTALLRSDTRVAWEGAFPDRSDIAIRVEAASSRGRPVHFAIIAPWTKPEPPRGTTSDTIFDVITAALSAGLLIGGALLCRRNLRLGRGDREGAVKLALYMAFTFAIEWTLRSENPFLMLMWIDQFLFRTGAQALMLGALTWLAYLAVEPYVRRRWPEMLISWSRLLAGKFRDPLIGRDLLVGSSLGVVLFLLFQLARTVPAWLGAAPPAPDAVSADVLGETRYVVAGLFGSFGVPAFLGVMGLFFLLLLRVVLRKQWLAVLVWIALVTFQVGIIAEGGGGAAWSSLLLASVQAAICAAILLRGGLIQLIVAFFAWSLLARCPLTLDPSAWYAARSYFCLATLTAFAAYGFFTATAGRRRFSAALLED